MKEAEAWVLVMMMMDVTLMLEALEEVEGSEAPGKGTTRLEKEELKALIECRDK